MSVMVARSIPTDALPAVPRRAWLARRDPLAVLFGALVLNVPVVLSLDPVTAGVVLAASLVALPFSAVSGRRLLLFTLALVLGGLVAVWGTALVAPDSGPVLLNFIGLTVTSGSLYSGALVGLRSLAVAVPAVVLLGSVDATRLADALAVRLRLPERFVLGALGALRLGGLLTEEWRVLAGARRARGIGGGGSFSLVFALLVQAIRRGTRLAVTMDAKGFGAPGRSWARPVRTGAADVALLLGCVLVAGLAVAVSHAAGTWSLVW